MSRRNKRKKQLIIFIIIVIVLLVGVYALDLGNIRTYVENSKIHKNCNKEIIPSYLLVWTQYSGEQNNYFGDQIITSGLEDNPYGVFTKDPVWNDGVTIGHKDYYGNLDTICRVGSKSGENVNYRYCEGFTYSKTIQNVLDNGEIKGYESYNYVINLTIEKEPFKKEPLQQGYFFYYNVVNYEC